MRTLDDYWGWLQVLIDESGGFLVNDYLDVQLLGSNEDTPTGLFVHDQRLQFWDESFMEFTLTINADLEQTFYNFHYQDGRNELIFRKDMHPGHEDEVGGLTHIHDNPGDPDAVRAYEEVDLHEVLQEIHLYQEGYRP